MQIEYRVRPVTRYIVTRYMTADGASDAGSSVAGEYDNADMAYEVAYALARAEHDRLGWVPGDHRMQYPRHPPRGGHHMIEPTVGRVVLFTPPPSDVNAPFAPLAAIIAHVWGPRLVNLAVFDKDGNALPGVTSVMLLQDDDEKPSWGRYAEWMPYQKGQAAKTQELENELEKALGADK